MKKTRKMTLRKREMVSGLLFISPWIVGIVVFFFINLGQSAVFSFHNVFINAEEGGLDLSFVGLRHYHHMFLEHGTFVRTLGESLFLMIVNVPLIIFFSLLMAILLNREFLGRGMVRAIFFLPVVMATSAIEGSLELIMQMMMGGVSSVPPDVALAQSGFDSMGVARMLANFGMPLIIIDYIVDAIAMIHDVIRASGVQILIFLAALQAIPPSMYEVAQIEGATGYESFWKITVPMVSPLILTNVVYTIVDTFIQSDVVQMAQGTAFASVVLEEGVRGFHFGLGSAMSLVSSLLACLVLLIIGWSVSKLVFYYH